LFCFFFFFSSRRRHTRSYGDWSSDVCSSDLAAAQAQGLRMGFEAEGAVERQQRAVAIAQAKRRVPQLVPDQREVGVRLHRLLERRQRLAVALQLDQRRALERQGERGVSELGPGALGQPQRILASSLTAQQLEAL